MTIVLLVLLALVGLFVGYEGIVFQARPHMGSTRPGLKIGTWIVRRDLPILFGAFVLFMAIKGLAGF